MLVFIFGGGFVCLFGGVVLQWHDKCLIGEDNWESHTFAKPMEARTVLCQHKKVSLVLPLGVSLLSVAYVSTITYVVERVVHIWALIFIDFFVEASA